jgi:cathepsin L
MLLFLHTVFSLPLVLPHEERSFVAFMRAHSLLYTGAEYHLRFGVFLANRRLVREFNSGDHSFTLSVNHLSCLTPAEYFALFHSPDLVGASKVRTDFSDPPDSWDWRDRGAIVPVQDQGQCGSSGVIAGLSAQSGGWQIAHGILIALSDKAISQCATSGACDDSFSAKQTYDYALAHQNGHFLSAADYPPFSSDCPYDPAKAVTTITGYFTSLSGDESGLQGLIGTVGPAAIGIDASHTDFQLYSGGIYNPGSCSSVDLDHEMLLLGYGADGATQYWILQNSWGTGWGEAGYMRIIRNAGNRCGVATASLFPTEGS